MYFGSPCYCYVLNRNFVYLAIPGTRMLFMRKQHLFVDLYAAIKVKFTSVPINMKQASYKITNV